jgi:alpha-glucosidase
VSYVLEKDLEKACRNYSAMGIKGFKVDFMDRDDQPMVQFFRDAARTAAKYHMFLDFHGAFKPSGLQRTYPNVLNYEAVNGLEQVKWGEMNRTTGEYDQVEYETIVPFIRMLAGPLDYTQGAMRNASASDYRPVGSNPMSQGTRCRQLAEYVIFESPFNMLCDSPSNYMREIECTRFIVSCPTVWDETVVLEGKIGEYVAIARRKGDKWYVGAITDWTGRDMTLDLSGILGGGSWKMDVFRDGVNADRAASDYRHESSAVPSSGKVSFHMASGGGWAAVLSR